MTELNRNASIYGHWATRDGLPAFNYTANPLTLGQAEWDPIVMPKTRRHVHVMGNLAISAVVDNMGTTSIWDESEIQRYLNAPDHQKGGSGVTLIREADGTEWGTSLHSAPEGITPVRQFGPQFFAVSLENNGLTVERDMILPEGEVPWVFVRVRLNLAEGQQDRTISVKEEWAVSPLYMATLTRDHLRRGLAQSVGYEVILEDSKALVKEAFYSEHFPGKPAELMLEALSDIASKAETNGEQHPTLSLNSEITLKAGETRELYFRFGRDDSETIENVEGFYGRTVEQAKARMIKAQSDLAPEVTPEMMWHSASILGLVNKDNVMGNHTLNQGGNYGFHFGINAAARDPYIDSISLAYTHPELALSVLRNTCSWAFEDGNLPFTLLADKTPNAMEMKPSDMNLYALWSASEYAAVTGDLKAFDELLAYHPSREYKAVSLKEHLLRQYNFFHNSVGRGLNNHVRIQSGDWQDVVLFVAGDHAEEMIEKGSSVLNSAAAAYILPRFATLLDKLGESELAISVREEAEDLRQLVSKAFNGKWFDRAYGPNGLVVGRDDCWLDVNGMALICGAATDEQARLVIENFKKDNVNSPLGIRAVWPHQSTGEEAYGGVWYVLNMVFITACRKYDPEFALELFRRTSLANHTQSYPSIWEGVLSGPDCWNAPESKRPGRTWGAWGEQYANEEIADDDPRAPMTMMSAQSFPVANTHSHASPILSYIRLAGIDTNSAGELEINPGIGSFESKMLKVNKDGSGWIKSDHEITVKSVNGTFTGKGLVTF